MEKAMAIAELNPAKYGKLLTATLPKVIETREEFDGAVALMEDLGASTRTAASPVGRHGRSHRIPAGAAMFISLSSRTFLSDTGDVRGSEFVRLRLPRSVPPPLLDRLRGVAVRNEGRFAPAGARW